MPVKLAIDMEKKKMVILWLESKGIVPAKNAKLRRIQVITKLKEDNDG